MKEPAQVSSSPEESLRPELQAGEQLLWAGRPRARFRLLGGATTLFMLVWTGVAFSIAFTALSHPSTNTPALAALVPLAFVAIGLNQLLGWPIRAWLREQRTLYGVTNERLLFCYNGPKGRSVQSLDLGDISSVDKTVRPDGSGTLTFGERGSSALGRVMGPGVRAQWGSAYTLIPMHVFADIPGVEAVADTLEQARPSH